MALKSELNTLTNAIIKENESLSKHTTIGVGGKAKYFLSINGLLDYKRATEILKNYSIPYKIIGKGSNLLCSDSGYNGAIISYHHDRIYKEKDSVFAFSGANLNNLIMFLKNNGYSGLEYLFGIPASVGGAIVNNAGAFSHNISTFLSEVYAIYNGKLVILYKEDCAFSYRTSIFRDKDFFIYKAKFNFPQKEKQEISKTIKEIVKERKLRFPVGKTFGSVFKNTENKSAGELIEQCGLKGLRFGGAKLSEKHCNFIINEKATAKDIKDLIEFIKKEVKNKFNISLREEVEYIGDF